MMTLSNEQRAHDLALAAAQDIIKNPDYYSNPENDLDFYNIYLKAYLGYLKQIISDFG